jgi:hypothetical protein
MIIQSSFRDYYDFVAKLYRGGDPKIVYVRNEMKKNLEIEVTNCPFVDLYGYETTKERMEHEYAYLVVAGKLYLLSRPRYTEKNFVIVSPDQVLKDKSKLRFWSRQCSITFGKEHQFLIDLSIKIQSPVFIINTVQRNRDNKSLIFINKHCPRLDLLGMASLISPYQMYQDLSYFIGNTMKVPPDTAPPVQLSNRERIIKAGFDLVTSFRHRK